MIFEYWNLSNIKPSLPIPDIFTPATIRNGLLIKFKLGSETAKNVQIDPQTTEIWSKAKRDAVSE